MHWTLTKSSSSFSHRFNLECDVVPADALSLCLCLCRTDWCCLCANLLSRNTPWKDTGLCKRGRRAQCCKSDASVSTNVLSTYSSAFILHTTVNRPYLLSIYPVHSQYPLMTVTKCEQIFSSKYTTRPVRVTRITLTHDLWAHAAHRYSGS